MDELVKLVAERTNLPEDKAKLAVETVMEFIKEKLPAPVAAQVENALKNESLMGKAGDALNKGLGGLFGKK